MKTHGVFIVEIGLPLRELICGVVFVSTRTEHAPLFCRLLFKERVSKYWQIGYFFQQLVARPSSVNYMVAPVTGNDAGIRRAEIKQGIREVILCKDQDGKIGLRLKSIDNVSIFLNFWNRPWHTNIKQLEMKIVWLAVITHLQWRILWIYWL